MGIEDQTTQSYQTIGQPPSAPQLAPMTGQGLSGQGMLPDIFQNMASKLGQLGQLNQQNQQNGNTGTLKPQLGTIPASLHQIADQLQRTEGSSQIGKFGANMGQAGLMNQMGQANPNQYGGAQQFPLAQQSPQQIMSWMSQRGFAEGGLTDAAEHLASKGRNGDTELLHVTKDEIRGLLAAAKEQGIEMKRNPYTGLYEASWLSKAAKKVASVVTKPVVSVVKAVKNTVGPIVTKVRDLTQTGLNAMTFGATKNLTSKGAQKNFAKIKDAVGPIYTKLRDVAESAAVLAGNYFVPGSSMLTSQLASKGSQKLLNSGIGQLAQMATGNLAGAGGGLAALKSGLSNAFSSGGSGFLSSLKSLGSNVMGGIKGLADKGSNFLSSVKGGISNLLSNPGQSLKDLGSKAMDYLKEKGGDLKDTIKDKLKDKLTDMLNPKQSGEAAEEDSGSSGGGNDLLSRLSGVMGDPEKRAQLISGLSSLYGAHNQEQDPREKAGMTNLPNVQFQNMQLKRVPNPNYGKPGEPFYLSQEFTPAQPAAAPTTAAGGGLMSTGYAMGGMPSYAPGGNVEEYQAGGKLLDGPGDGMSDSIQAEIRGKKVQKALLADGEFVVPADVVSGLGNGSTKAGAKVLYGMMNRVRKARTGTTEQGKQIDPNRVIPA